MSGADGARNTKHETPSRCRQQEQGYLWGEPWQEGEREAEENLCEGRTECFETLDDLIADLDTED